MIRHPWHDTMPSGPVPLDQRAREHEGDDHTDEETYDGERVIRGLMTAVGVTLLAASVGCTLAMGWQP